MYWACTHLNHHFSLWERRSIILDWLSVSSAYEKWIRCINNALKFVEIYLMPSAPTRTERFKSYSSQHYSLTCNIITYAITRGSLKDALRKCSRKIPQPVATSTTIHRYCSSCRMYGTVRVATMQANELTDLLKPSPNAWCEDGTSLVSMERMNTCSTDQHTPRSNTYPQKNTTPAV